MPEPLKKFNFEIIFNNLSFKYKIHVNLSKSSNFLLRKLNIELSKKINLLLNQKKIAFILKDIKKEFIENN